MAKLADETVKEISLLIRGSYSQTDDVVGKKLALVSKGEDDASYVCLRLMADAHIEQAIRLLMLCGHSAEKIAEEFYSHADELAASKINRG